GASAVIYGGLEEKGIAFENVDQALLEPQTEIRLFGKPESFIRRRMGVAVAVADSTDAARIKAKKVASAVQPVR
ncbi:MAG: phosphoribosylglycinamide formyltransferase 2, partial [Gammaproteobacteria bacterium]|nr:phosphoribosylglycinamide formyltransferase 2 [Gammaproteobacteria bacterium]